MTDSMDQEQAGALDEGLFAARDGRTGRAYLSGPGLHEFPVGYMEIDGRAIHEGDIDLGDVQEVDQETARIDAARATRRDVLDAGLDRGVEVDDRPVLAGVGVPGDSSYIWPNAVLPYTVNSDVPNPGRVQSAIEHIERNTPLRLPERTDANASRYPNYIEIVSNGEKRVSRSAVGRQGGRQVISFSDRHSWQILVHEICHAAGCYHEQSRSDRDDYVTIKWDNITEKGASNFQKKPGSVDYYEYDYDSLMHYPATSFAIDASKPTIVPKQSGVTIGQRVGLSFGDRQALAKMYERQLTRGYSGVWREGSGKYGVWVNAGWKSFLDKRNEWAALGLRLSDINVRHTRRGTRYSGVFLPGSGPHGLWANVGWSSFRSKWQEWSAQGLRLVDLHVHEEGGESRYSGVFLPGSGPHGLWAGVEWNSFRSKWQEWSAQGLRLIDINTRLVAGRTLYYGVFLPGSGGYGLWANVGWSSFVEKWQELSAQGLRLVDISTHREGGEIKYSGVFLPGRDNYYLWANVTYEGLRAKWDELAATGLRLIDLEITEAVGVASDANAFRSESGAQDGESEEVGGIIEVKSSIDINGIPRTDAEGGGGILDSNDNERNASNLDAASSKPGEMTHDADTDGEFDGLGGLVLSQDSSGTKQSDQLHGGFYFPAG